MRNESKLDFIFRFVPAETRAKLRFDQEALWSATDQLTADKITKDLARWIPATATIVDATACVGGNTWSFAQGFQKVIAFEIDSTRAGYLRNNMAVLGAENVVVIHGDAIRKIPGLIGPPGLAAAPPYDLLFIDPPWGGPEYKSVERLSLSLGGFGLAEACCRLARGFRFIALKVPNNFDEVQFIEDTRDHLEFVYKNPQLRKMSLMLFRPRGGSNI